MRPVELVTTVTMWDLTFQGRVSYSYMAAFVRSVAARSDGLSVPETLDHGGRGRPLRNWVLRYLGHGLDHPALAPVCDRCGA